MRLTEQVSAQQREEQTRIAFHADMGRFWTHFSPRNGFPQTSTREATVVFGCRRDVDGAVESTSVLIPPNHVVLGNTTAHHQRVGRFNVPGQIAHDLLVGQGVEVEIAVLLPEHEQLRTNGAVRNAGNADRNLVFGGPVNERVRGADALSKFPNEVNGAKTNPGIGTCFAGFLQSVVVDVFEDRHDHGFDDLAVRCVGDDDVTEAHQSVLAQFNVIEVKGAVVVVLVRSCDVVVKRSAGG